MTGGSFDVLTEGVFGGGGEFHFVVEGGEEGGGFGFVFGGVVVAHGWMEFWCL